VTREKSKRKWFYVILILLLLGAGAFYFWGRGEQNGSNQRYRLVRVERGEISSTVTATGTINPVVTVLVGSQVSGTIKALYADFNSRVKEGDIIAQIDPAIFQAQVDEAKAGVATAQANLANAQANLQSLQANLVKAEVAVSDAKRTLDRNVQLMKMSAIAQSALDTAQANYDSAVAQREANKAQLEVAKAQIESAKAQIEHDKAALRMTETNLRYTTIRSPVNGVVISRNVDVGQTVAASLQAPILFTIAKDLTEMQVDTNFSEADIGRIETGQEATFTVDAYPEITFRGKVSEIRNAPQTIQNVVTYDVVIRVANPDLKLKPGMTANVTLLVAHRDGALRIPNAALRFRPVGASGENGEEGMKKEEPKKEVPQTAGPSEEQRKKLMKMGSSSQEKKGMPGRAWILSPQGKPILVPVVLGITNGTFSEIISGDLKEGTQVIVGEMTKDNAQNRGTPSPLTGGGLRR
jgi:HlyD family secretion protein